MISLQLPRPHESAELDALRAEVRAFLATELRNTSYSFFGEFDPAFSEALGRRGWVGMSFPRQYGGGARSVLERHVVLEELLAARAPIYAHSIADRQSGPLLLRFGQEWQRREILPKIAAGTCYFCIGMSEPDSGSDLAECLGGSEAVLEEQLDTRYETLCDPRLNARQSLDLAFRVAELMRG